MTKEHNKEHNCCEQPLITKNKEYYICMNCGIVADPIIDDSDGVSGNGSGIVGTYIQKGSPSFICKDNSYIKCDIFRLHVQNNYNNKQKSYNNFENLISILDYPPCVISTSKDIWTCIMNTGKIIRGSVRLGVIMCCVYYSCCYHGCNRTPLELSNEFSSTTKVFNKGDKAFKDIIKDTTWSFLISKEISCENYFTRFCYKLVIIGVLSEKDAWTLRGKVQTLYDSIKPCANSSNLAIALISYVYDGGGNNQLFIKTFGISEFILKKLQNEVRSVAKTLTNNFLCK
jgi:hypothetical protein